MGLPTRRLMQIKPGASSKKHAQDFDLDQSAFMEYVFDVIRYHPRESEE
jgi:hypothetical protein